MNLYIKLLFAIMILYTFYNFYMDFRGVINGGTFLEGNQNMKPAEYMGHRGGYDFSSAAEAEAKCKEEGLQLCTKEEVIAGAKSNDKYENVCSSGWTKDAPRGWYSVKGRQWCGTDNNWNTYAPPSGKGSAHCCKPAPVPEATDTTGRCGPLFNEKKCEPGSYCNEKNGWCGTTDAHKNAQDSTKYDGPKKEGGITKEEQDALIAMALLDNETKGLTQKIFDYFKVPYSTPLTVEQLQQFLRKADTDNEFSSDPAAIQFAAAFVLGFFDFNKNQKLDFNELLVILFSFKMDDPKKFKDVENVFSGSHSNNNNNNNNIHYQALANGNLVIPATGRCPNGCKMPAYDHKDCENTLYNGKSYRQCPWISAESSHDCGQCGAVLLPKNEHGYARTQIGYSDIRSLEIISKRIERQRLESKKQISKSEFFNIGKEFLKQHGELKGYDIPNNITVKEYTLLGKVLFIYLANKTPKNRSTLKNYIDSLYLEHYLNNKCDNCENNAESFIDKDTKFTLDELKKRDAYAYTEGIVETESDNRLGGSRTQYENRTAYRSNYKPLDPRKFPNPYNSMWDVFP